MNAYLYLRVTAQNHRMYGYLAMKVSVIACSV